MQMSEYKRKQKEFEDKHLRRYNLEPVNLTPVEQFYAERECSYGLALLCDLLPMESVRTILVCGVGAGADLHYWLTRLSLKWCVGLDFSVEAIRASQRRIHLNDLPDIVDFFQGDFEDIPLRKNSVDLGIFVHTLHHALDAERGFRELWRISKRGVLLIEPVATPITRLFVHLGLAKDVEKAGNKVIRFTLRQLLQWAGVECSAYRSRTYLHYYHPLIYRRLLPVFNSSLGVPTFRFLYGISDALLMPLHSKMAVMLLKRDE